MDNFNIFIQLINLNLNNGDFSVLLGMLINQRIINRTTRLTIRETVILTEIQEFGYFIRDIDENLLNINEYIEANNINDNLLFSEFLEMIHSRNESIEFLHENRTIIY